MSGVDERVETVREALLYWKVGRLCYTPKYEDALNSLAAAVADAEQERATFAAEWLVVDALLVEVAKAGDTRDERDALRAELAELRETHWKDMRSVSDAFLSRAEAAEQRAADAEKALERIKDNAEAWHGNGEEGPRRALVVIAKWCDDALAVLGHATPAAEAEITYDDLRARVNRPGMRIRDPEDATPAAADEERHG